MFEDLGLRQYCVHYRGPIRDSEHSCILPADTRKNLHTYDPERDSPKPFIEFREPLWRAQDIYVALRSIDSGEWSGIVGARHGLD